MTFIAIDWGSSNCRAYLWEDGRISARKAQATGVKSLKPDEFGPVFDALVEDWRHKADTVYLTGMITSRSGWAETPYAPCPASLADIASQAITRQRHNQTLVFLPGLCQRGARADVMRGEEMQIFGLADGNATQFAVLPGTHSKWAHVDKGSVLGFATIMTGEIFDLVLNQSLAGRLAEGTGFDEAVFRKAVERSLECALTISDLFAARSSVLLNDMAGSAVASYLSGLLIGAEIREGLAAFPKAAKGVVLAGNEALLDRYRIAFGLAGVTTSCAEGEPALRAIAQINQLGAVLKV